MNYNMESDFVKRLPCGAAAVLDFPEALCYNIRKLPTALYSDKPTAISKDRHESFCNRS